MTAKEFIEKEGLEYSLAEYDEGGFLGIDEHLLEQKLEEYHQYKLKLLGIPVVVQAKPEKVCKGSMRFGNGCGKCKKCKREREHM